MNNMAVINEETIKNRIYSIRGLQVMLDRDLAELYGVETKRLNEQVKRNIERFPNEFMFQLTKSELENWKSQFATSNKEFIGLRKMPFAFTEQGVSMLSTVLKSDIAVSVSISIMKSFVQMRKFISNNALVFQRLDSLEQKQFKTDEKVDAILDAIESKELKPKQGIFYDGQVYDAYIFVSDLKKHNTQYANIELKKFNSSHDRFLIIDDKDVYHIGASLKDLGKKWFAFSRFEIDALEILAKLK